MTIIYLAALPKPLSRQKVGVAVRWNLYSARSCGRGNRAKRRMGIPPIDSTVTHPQGMGTGELSKFLNTPPE